MPPSIQKPEQRNNEKPPRLCEGVLTRSLLRRGAGSRTRTGTDFTPRDFKSLVSANFTMPAAHI